MKIKTLLLILLALLITGVATQADNVALHVSVHDDHAGSSAILKNNFAAGERQTKMALRIEQSLAGHSTTSAELYNNLCISQIKLDKIDKARTTCKRALSHAMQMVSGIGQNPKRVKHIKASALSNRGVLNMLEGNLDRALANFSRASQLSPSLDIVQLNLEAATVVNNRSGLAVVFE